MKGKKLPVLLFSAVLALSLVSPVVAETADNILGGLKNTGTQAGLPIDSAGKPERGFIETIALVTNEITIIVGAFFVALIMYGGWLWFYARGREDQVTQAKYLLLGAVIGLAIIIAARLIAELTLSVLQRSLPG